MVDNDVIDDIDDVVDNEFIDINVDNGIGGDVESVN